MDRKFSFCLCDDYIQVTCPVLSSSASTASIGTLSSKLAFAESLGIPGQVRLTCRCVGIRAPCKTNDGFDSRADLMNVDSGSNTWSAEHVEFHCPAMVATQHCLLWDDSQADWTKTQCRATSLTPAAAQAGDVVTVRSSGLISGVRIQPF